MRSLLLHPNPFFDLIELNLLFIVSVVETSNLVRVNLPFGVNATDGYEYLFNHGDERSKFTLRHHIRLNPLKASIVVK